MNKKTSKIFSLIAVILALISLITIFFDQVAFVNDSGKEIISYDGLKVTFGHKEEVLGSMQRVLGFSFANIVKYVLVCIGLVFTLLRVVKKGFLSNIFVLGSVVFFFASAFLFFFTPTFTIVQSSVLSVLQKTLSPATIIGGIASALAGVFAQLATLKR